MSPEGSTVTFRRVSRVPGIQQFARKLQREVAKRQPFDILITGDAEMRRLNREFRGKDYATDVLSFSGAGFSLRGTSVPPSGAQRAKARSRLKAWPHNLGDLAISLPRARVQAREFGHSTETEIRILMLHGLLHLLGMDHESDGGRMARAEKRWRAKLGLPDGLIERVHS